jgi:hypothetical protein
MNLSRLFVVAGLALTFSGCGGTPTGELYVEPAAVPAGFGRIYVTRRTLVVRQAPEAMVKIDGKAIATLGWRGQYVDILVAPGLHVVTVDAGHVDMVTFPHRYLVNVVEGQEYYFVAETNQWLHQRTPSQAAEVMAGSAKVAAE